MCLQRIRFFYAQKPSKARLRKVLRIKKADANASAFGVLKWALLDSNQRPPACKAGALNQLS